MLRIKALTVEGSCYEDALISSAPLSISDGVWVAPVKTAAPPWELYSSQSREIKLDLYGTDRHRILPATIDVHRSSKEPDDPILWWEHMIMSQDQFVAVWRSLYGFQDPSYSISYQVRDGRFQPLLPDLFPLFYQRGTNRWSWVRLEQVLSGHGIASLNGVPDLIWDLISTRVFVHPDIDPPLWTHCGEARACDARERNDWNASYKALDVTMTVPTNPVMQAVLPFYGQPPEDATQFMDLLLDQIWIPGPLAKNLSYLLKFVK